MYSYPHHIGDFIRDTARLTDSQAMTYLRLLWHYYDTESPLPKDIGKLCFMLGACPEDARLILEHFFDETPDCWRHKRCDSEIAAYRNRQAHGAKAAKSRWNNAQSMPRACPEHAPSIENDANREPITDNHIKEQKRSRALVCPPEVSPQVWDDFIAVRKANRSPLTETALRGIEREAQKAGWSLEQALAECAARGWRGFKAEWVRENKTLRDALDKTRMQNLELVNKTMRNLRNAQSSANGTTLGQIEHSLRGSVESEMGSLGPVYGDE